MGRNKDEDRGQGSFLGKQQKVSGLDADGPGFPHTGRQGGKGETGGGPVITRDRQKDRVEGDGNLVCVTEPHVASVERGAAGA